MDAVEDIKSRLSIEDVISRYVELKRAGRNFKGMSPFNSEKTPSFMVSPEKQIWHDFSSGKGGNMFSFVMEMEGVDFKTALEQLARQAGVDLSQYQSSRTSAARSSQKERLYKALDLAAKYYQVQFKTSKTAQDYVIKKRRFNKQSVLDFRIGYSPSSGEALTKFLIGKGFKLQELKLAGLTTQRRSGHGDMFRGRVMIPLMDSFGKVIGFTARQLTDEPNSPKYINTPQSMVYDKSRHVFGLHLAKEAIRKSEYVVVAEGNLDVIASHQAGIKQVVATAGTAMTESHLKSLGRLTQDIRLAFDQDKAGIQAAERTIPIASKTGVTLSIITVSEGKDPDELIQKDPKLWEQAISKPKYAVDWLIDKYRGELDLDSAQGKKKFTDILLKVVAKLDDSVEQDHYIVQLSEIVGVSPNALRDKVNKSGSEQRPILRRTNVMPISDKSKQELVKTQNHFLSVMLMQAGLRMYLKNLDPDIFLDTRAQKLYDHLVKNPKFAVADADSLPTETRDFIKILLLLYEELYSGLELLELRYEAAQLQARMISQYVRIKKTEIAHAMRETGETTELLKQAKELDTLLRTIKDKVNG